MQRVKGVAKGKAKAKAKQKRAGEEYGFFAENAALKLEVPQGEKLVLEKEGPGTKRTIYEWPYVYRPEPFEIWIKNIRDPKRPHSDKSDFRLYYKIFKKEVPEALQYDFYIKEGEKRRPYNPVPPKPSESMGPMRASKKNGQYGPRTCCGLECNVVMLRGIALH
jgi:hypothetical protein